MSNVTNKIRVAQLNAELKVVKAEMLAELPVATEAQYAACATAAREVVIGLEVSRVASGLNKEFRLSEHQKEQLSAEKETHTKNISTPEVKAEAVAKVTACTLKTFKLKTMKNGKVALSITGTI